ncbi:MAG: ATP-binding cassette domain-containing protein [Desulfobacterales bacterium]|nr:ATP-binding cassette domain-containing protein [Desulfobacterales bacterium]
MTILEVKNIDKLFPGVKALKDVSMTIEKGEIRGLIGPNGSGKTTMIRTILGFYKQDKGDILYEGESLFKDDIWTRVNKGLSLTYQTPTYVSGLSIYRHIELGTIAKNIPGKRIYEIAEEVGLADNVNKDPSELTALSAKKLEIAKALSTNPQLLMLDEIFAGLSFEEGEQMIDMLKNLNKEKDMTILLIDHNLRMVKKMVNKTTVINMGVVIAEGSFDEIIEDEEVRKAYLG